MKVLFHINQPERWPMLIMNINNFLRDVGPGVASIEVVANGGGVLAYSKGERDMIAQLEDLHQRKVVFNACRNALVKHDLKQENLPDFVGIVPAGITAIVIKQSEGYAYIKP